jgi:Cof subfamily protein (haloacid dehalogenase superfamily)
VLSLGFVRYFRGMDTQPVAPDPPKAPTLGDAPVKLVATDVDGTILSYGESMTGDLSARTVEAFQAAQEAGIAVVLVTGRPVRGLRGISSTLGLLGPVIASNGAMTYDLAADTPLDHQPLAAQSMFEVKDLILELDPTVAFAAETPKMVHMEESFARGSLWFEDKRRRAVGIRDEELLLGPLDETLERNSDWHPRPGPSGPQIPVLKLLAKTHAMAADDFIAAAQERIGHMVTVTHSAPGISLLEISAKGVNKAQALRRYAHSLGIGAEHTIAFGDMPNDIEMLQWAGTSWAVGSAHPMARSAADRIAGACEDDGVAEVLELLLKGRLPR